MRLTSIAFKGFKRLVDTGCNVDGRLIAFVGPNEAGKSSALEALSWLTQEPGVPLTFPQVSRVGSDSTVNRDVVTAIFTLGPEDQASLQYLDTDIVPRRLWVSRDRDGSRHSGLEPALSRRPAEGLVVSKELEDLLERNSFFDVSERGVDLASRLAVLQESLVDIDRTWSEAEIQNAEALSTILRTPQPEEADSAADQADSPDQRSDGLDPLDLKAASAIDSAIKWIQVPHPQNVGSDKMWNETPDFLLFTEADRVLQSCYELNDANFQAAVPAALRNLLSVAGTSAQELLSATQAGDESRRLTLEKNANRRLRNAISPRWKQSALEVHLQLRGTILDVAVEETADNGSVTVMSERSDGLKTFVALVAFLARRDSRVAPILLIDEAETHLHYDAQADLIDFLLDVEAVQVLYTTHSPGCLPPDLGTGVRLVAPDRDRPGSSKLRNDFWTSRERGFTPLLFAMGAGAAAFSACRRAILAEGPSDMILLPSLIRKAMDLPVLDYQVAPGLAVIPPSGFADAELSAAKVVYLVDGDEGGNVHVEHLKDAGVDFDRIIQLPKGLATEDLLDVEFYLAAVNGVLAESGEGRKLTAQELDPLLPASSAVTAICKRDGLHVPGKTAVASRLVRTPEDLILSIDGMNALRALHVEATRLFA